MSLTSFIGMADVMAKLKPLRPGPPRKIPAALMVEPRSKRFMMVGTAFDYLLRFELQRRAPHAVARSWVAESAPDIIWKQHLGARSFMNLSRDENGVISKREIPRAREPNAWTVEADRDGLLHVKGIMPVAAEANAWADHEQLARDERLAQEISGQVRNVIERAKLAHSAHLQNTSPTRTDQADLAAHAIRLAKLDDIPRAGRFDSTTWFEEPAAEDVEDLLAMLPIVPFDVLLHDKVLFLNPVFEQTSQLVGGADADLIVGDMLVDFKTTKNDRVDPTDLDQLLGYYLLARRQRQADPKIPAIKRLAIYFCRHGYLWTWDTTTWTGHPQFAETEEWFFSRAKEVFKTKPVEINWSGVKMDAADRKLTLAELIRSGKLRVQPRPQS